MEQIPHKIQDPGAPGSGVMEGENAACVSGENPWQNVPNLNFNRNDRKIKLDENWYDNDNSNWAVPSFVRDSPSPPLLKRRGGGFMKLTLTILRASVRSLAVSIPSANRRHWKRIYNLYKAE
jgi:hypothetical protein